MNMVDRPDFCGRRGGFTLPEVLVVTGIIAILIAMILPALAGALRTSDMAKSMSRMKQIGLWMRVYEGENREVILPSQVDYRDKNSLSQTLNNYPVKVRSDNDLTSSPDGNVRWQATWTDVLWTVNGLGGKHSLIDPAEPANLDKYLFDSPDRGIYGASGVLDDGPFRSSAPMTRELPGADGIPKPFGAGAQEVGYSGYFAANDFFNARWDAPDLIDPNNPPSTIPTPANGRWWVTGQMIAPDRSMYLVDSLAGETIKAEPTAEAFDSADGDGDGIPDNLEVDFRYNGSCLMLFLDGHVDSVGPWKDICDLEQGNPRITVRELDRKILSNPCP
jgi:prepilin-type N-terminal cleavage/methylation domain-containing protein/prepilin-type processing-associated H-X9-DG protein